MISKELLDSVETGENDFKDWEIKKKPDYPPIAKATVEQLESMGCHNTYSKANRLKAALNLKENNSQ